MNTDLASAVELADDVVAACSRHVDRCDIALFPPFVYLQAVGHRLGHHGIMLGAQDVYPQPNGAFTGEISTEMLLDLNVVIVLVGHSERRHIIGEGDELVRDKLHAVLDAGLQAMLCVGETLEQREAGRTDQINVHQVMSALDGVPADRLRQVTIAYEPVWAIGTGVNATAADAEAAQRKIRQTVRDLYDGAAADSMRILYGGSLKASNAMDIFAQPNVDGGLVGGSSLKVDEWTGIVAAAAAAAHSHTKAIRQ
jgi:triosephosphate isomerase